jgi:hypothetical protein
MAAVTTDRCPGIINNDHDVIPGPGTRRNRWSAEVKKGCWGFFI